MATVNYFLVILGYAALICNSAAQSTTVCTTVLYGGQSDDPRPLTPITLTPGVQRELISIHSGCDSIGVQVTACDDVAPLVNVVNATLAIVDRMGTLLYPGYASVIAYCPTIPLVVKPVESDGDVKGDA